ncbi:SAM domain and HD [Bulinus truncatus]|nr:SAM domain and HD [Bulinus truncatus]
MTICWKDWSLAEFYADLEDKKISPSIIDTIQKETGSIQKDLKVRHILPLLTIDELISRNLRYDDCLMLVKYLEKLDQKTKPLSSRLSELYCDPIHGHIELHPACQMIVDTPQFQRLRFIKQLGMVYYVYPGASHNRFEHSLGVCHLAGEFARTLQQNQPFLGITDKDILCIQIAGLCQDLGRGPFSRVFIDYFMPAMHPDKQFKKPCLEMFNHLIEVNNLKEKLKHFGLDDKDMLFIQENISGPKATGSTAWPYKGRREDKAYLYEIVSNKRNGIDVYKWDYLSRDCHHLGLANNFDSLRYMKLARVVEEDGEVQICVRDKEIGNLYSMFYTRYNLDKCAYKHRVSYGLEIMVTEALILADDHVTYKGKNNEWSSTSPQCVVFNIPAVCGLQHPHCVWFPTSPQCVVFNIPTVCGLQHPHMCGLQHTHSVWSSTSPQCVVFNIPTVCGLQHPHSVWSSTSSLCVVFNIPTVFGFQHPHSVWSSTYPQCVVFNIPTVCGLQHTHSVWSSTSPQCVVFNIPTVCGLQHPHSVWSSTSPLCVVFNIPTVFGLQHPHSLWSSIYPQCVVFNIPTVFGLQHPHSEWSSTSPQCMVFNIPTMYGLQHPHSEWSSTSPQCMVFNIPTVSGLQHPLSEWSSTSPQCVVFNIPTVCGLQHPHSVWSSTSPQLVFSNIPTVSGLQHPHS